MNSGAGDSDLAEPLEYLMLFFRFALFESGCQVALTGWNSLCRTSWSRTCVQIPVSGIVDTMSAEPWAPILRTQDPRDRDGRENNLGKGASG